MTRVSFCAKISFSPFTERMTRVKQNFPVNACSNVCFLLILARKNKFVRADLDDPWHTLRAPARMMTGLPNLDGSAQLLIYDRNTYVIFIYTMILTYHNGVSAVRRGCDKFIIEVWNVTNGELIHETILDCVGDVVIGFYVRNKKTAISVY